MTVMLGVVCTLIRVCLCNVPVYCHTEVLLQFADVPVGGSKGSEMCPPLGAQCVISVCSFTTQHPSMCRHCEFVPRSV